MPTRSASVSAACIDVRNGPVADRLYVLGPAMNTRLIKQEDFPKTFDDLLDPKWTGKIVWRRNNLTGATGFVGNVLVTMGEEKGMGLTTLSARPNAGRLFLEYAISREGQTVFQKAGYIPTHPAVPPLEPKLLPEGGGFKGNVLTPDFVAQNRKKWDDIVETMFR